VPELHDAGPGQMQTQTRERLHRMMGMDGVHVRGVHGLPVGAAVEAGSPSAAEAETAEEHVRVGIVHSCPGRNMRRTAPAPCLPPTGVGGAAAPRMQAVTAERRRTVGGEDSHREVLH
jgi:hypothetical protein